ncbi:GSCFA domain-containing protein [Algibacter sp. L4_22]|uniref:GSCFA domain-containing protein n=1 Tax=Algibacter sp. L4_22 TaxID=2942477 RepID=UPI00201B813B|nr:GSCFA domain-containing protein [Algibacter sp. L4_22]MCL5127665.1 GSCFA domain-containing protein [Algibacter sp. L4_22]
MKLQTQIPFLSQENNQIDYKSKILLFGSCFSDNIGKKLDYFKFENGQNPFGILFHPKAIENLIENAIQDKVYSGDDVFFHNEQWHCFDAHSKLSNSFKDVLVDKLNLQAESTKNQLKNASHIVITLGTAWVYNLIETNSIVANCHKIPQKQFNKTLLSVEEITTSLKNILSQIRSLNNSAIVIFTVSPVRHIKDGFVENTQSKSHLLTAIHQVISQKSFYFPSYEIMMDELRDYRFYTEDMIHPNATAINYIWEKFQQVWISNDALNIMQAVDVVQKGIKHKAFNPNSEAHLKFLQQLENKKETLQSQFPSMVF